MKRASVLLLAILLGPGILLSLLAIAPASAQDDARGSELYALCTQCHGGDGAGNPAARIPAIAGLDRRYVEAQLQKYRQGMRGAHFDDVSGMRMRPMALWLKDDADVAAVSGFVASLPPARPVPELEGGDAQTGAQLYANVCATCHEANAAGNPAKDWGGQKLVVPSLRHASDWYLLAQLKNFQQGIRGANPDRDYSGAQMRTFSMTLPSEQAMKDVIAYIGTLAE
jgi:cytochrome c553